MADKIFVGGMPLEYVILFILIFVFSLALGNFLNTIIRNIPEAKISRRTSKWIGKFFQYIILAAGLYIGIYRILRLDVTALAASLGIIGIIVAFSSQQIVQNILAGVIIAIQQPIHMEDWISAGTPDTGINRVKDMRLTMTVLEDHDGKTIFVPNSLILGSKIVNYSRMNFIELDIPLEIKQKHLEKSRKIILDVANRNKRVLPNIEGTKRFAVSKLLKLRKAHRVNSNSGAQAKNAVDDEFTPRILITDVSGPDVKLSIRVWVRDIEHREEIASEILGETIAKMKKARIMRK